ncbi:MAG: HAD hydrolase-like protein, partial [Pseudomonadota bacterium]
GVYSVGDSQRDLVAAQTVGAVPVLVKTGNGKKTLQALKQQSNDQLEGILVYDSLGKFVDALLLNDIQDS